MENRILVEQEVKRFLLEDLGFGDITTENLIDDSVMAAAEVIFKEEGIVAGIEEAATLFEMIGCRSQRVTNDGKLVKPQTIILKVEGPARAILAGERVALNIIMRMSGIASATNHALSLARKVNSKIRVAATRKTTPGFRYFEKKAVEIGGGDTHRLRLDDCVLIKDNHLKVATSIRRAVTNIVDKKSFSKKIEIEVESPSDALEAIEAGADIVMLDNMTPNEIQNTLSIIRSRKMRKHVLIEASGGITLKNITDFAKTGVDVLSLGSLTHSAQAIDVKLRIKSFKT